MGFGRQETPVSRDLVELNRNQPRVATLEALARLLLRAEAVASSC